MARLDGRRVLVTGASSGIGAAVARAVVSAGGTVALLARRPEVLRDLAADLGGVSVPADVTDVQAVRGAVAAAVDGLGGLDVVVNSAGVMRPGTVEDGRPDDFRLMLEVNVLGLLHVTHVALPHLRRSGAGDVVNISSMSGRRIPSPTAGVYAGTKFAVHAISEGLRLELADQPVRVTTVAPGYVDTPIGDGVDGDRGEKFRHQVATHGMSPDVVADLVVTALAAPREVELVEVAFLPTGEGRA